MISVLYLMVGGKMAPSANLKKHMEYPGAKFTRGYRKALFIITVALFFIISPILVFYSAGYRYDWHYGLLRETGSVSIDILPSNAVAYLDNVEVPDSMPIRLKSITSGIYRVRVSAPGYYDWEKEISVFDKQTTYIKDIQMIKKATPTLIASGVVDTISVSPDNTYIIFTTVVDTTKKVWLWNSITNDKVILTSFASEDTLIIDWSAKNNFVLLTNGKIPYGNAHIFSISGTNKNAIDITKRIANPILKLEWSDSVDGLLYVGTTTTVSAYQVTTNQLTTVTRNTFDDWHMETGQLWTLRTNTNTHALIITKDTLGFGQTFASIEPNTIDNEQPNTAQWHIAKIKDDVLLLQGKPEFVKIITATDQFDIPGKSFLLSTYNNWWLIWKPGELWTYNKGEKPYLLNRSGESLLGVVPLDPFNTLALSWNKHVTALFPYYLTYHNLLEISVSALAADSKNRTLYYGATQNKQTGLWSLTY